MAHDVGGAADILMDDGDADRSTDDDILSVDPIGRAERRDDTAGDGLQHRMIGGGGRDHGEFVAAEPGDHVVGAQRPRQPLRDAADQLVADRMAERVVDVLEVIEIDVEDRGGRASAANLGDCRFQPLAKEDAVRQPAERVMQCEMAQSGLAGRDRRRGAAHVAENDAC